MFLNLSVTNVKTLIITNYLRGYVKLKECLKSKRYLKSKGYPKPEGCLKPEGYPKPEGCLKPEGYPKSGGQKGALSQKSIPSKKGVLS